MSKFKLMLSSDSASTLSKRAEILAESTLGELDNFLSRLKSEKRELSTKLLDLTDLSPDNTYDLRPGGKNFNSKTWVESIHKLKMEIELKDVEIEVAEGIKAEWFTDETKAVKATK